MLGCPAPTDAGDWARTSELVALWGKDLVYPSSAATTPEHGDEVLYPLPPAQEDQGA